MSTASITISDIEGDGYTNTTWFPINFDVSGDNLLDTGSNESQIITFYDDAWQDDGMWYMLGTYKDPNTFLSGGMFGDNVTLAEIFGKNLRDYYTGELIGYENVGDYVIIAKDWKGMAWLPEWSFDGIGSMITSNTVKTWSLISGSNTVTLTSVNSFLYFYVGITVTSDGLPADTTITNIIYNPIDNGTYIATLSNPASSTGSYSVTGAIDKRLHAYQFKFKLPCYIEFKGDNCLVDNPGGPYNNYAGGTLRLGLGWNWFACPFNEQVDVVDFLSYPPDVNAGLIDKLILIKANNGLAYLPAWDFNAIGNLKPGQGYQMKTNNPHWVSHHPQIEYFTPPDDPPDPDPTTSDDDDTQEPVIDTLVNTTIVFGPETIKDLIHSFYTDDGAIKHVKSLYFIIKNIEFVLALYAPDRTDKDALATYIKDVAQADPFIRGVLEYIGLPNEYLLGSYTLYITENFIWFNRELEQLADNPQIAVDQVLEDKPKSGSKNHSNNIIESILKGIGLKPADYKTYTLGYANYVINRWNDIISRDEYNGVQKEKYLDTLIDIFLEAKLYSANSHFPVVNNSREIEIYFEVTDEHDNVFGRSVNLTKPKYSSDFHQITMNANGDDTLEAGAQGFTFRQDMFLKIVLVENRVIKGRTFKNVLRRPCSVTWDTDKSSIATHLGQFQSESVQVVSNIAIT